MIFRQTAVKPASYKVNRFDQGIQQVSMAEMPPAKSEKSVERRPFYFFLEFAHVSQFVAHDQVAIDESVLFGIFDLVDIQHAESANFKNSHDGRTFIIKKIRMFHHV